MDIAAKAKRKEALARATSLKQQVCREEADKLPRPPAPAGARPTVSTAIDRRARTGIPVPCATSLVRTGSGSSSRLSRCEDPKSDALTVPRDNGSREGTGNTRVVTMKRNSHGAATSHESNALYMEEFHSALNEMESSSARIEKEKPKIQGREAGRRALAGRKSTTEGRGALPRREIDFGSSAIVDSAPSADCISIGEEHITTVHNPVSGYKTGPLDTAGILYDASDRNILCTSLMNNECILGSADHALYGVNIYTGKKTRKLYTRACGHTDWVTCVMHMHTGEVISGGVDGKLCLWPAGGGVTCSQLVAHPGGVSRIRTSMSGMIASCGYGGDLWIHSTLRRKLVPGFHLQSNSITAPSTDFGWSNAHSTLISGHRDGHITVWDLGEGGRIINRFSAHGGGHVTVIENIFDTSRLDSPVFASGGQDGCIRLWDSRCSSCIEETSPHINTHGVGAVSGLKMIQNAGPGNMLISYGADNSICIHDTRINRQLARLQGHRNYIYSMYTVGNEYLLSGDGAGMLLVHSLKDFKLLYGLGCNQGAVRCICATDTHMIAAGDDGNACIYTFDQH